MKKLVYSFIFLFVLSGCYGSGGNIDLSRYISVSIPQYSQKDYLNLLSHKDDEIVYNAISNLIQDAKALATALSKKNMGERNASEECTGDCEQKARLAREIYEKISFHLRSDNTRVVSSAIRFLSVFGKKYDDKNEITQRLLEVTPGSDNVKLELIDALTSFADSETQVDHALVSSFLKDRSWMVSRAAYGLVNRLEDEDARLELINQYQKTPDEMEKLLILKAWRDNYGGEIFDVLKTEILNGKSERVKTYIYDLLDNAKNTQIVLDWLESDYGKLTDDDTKSIARKYYSYLNTRFGCSLFEIFIKKGFDPHVSLCSVGEEGEDKRVPDLFCSLYSAISSNSLSEDTARRESEEGVSDKKEKLKRLRSLESVIMQNSELASEWLNYNEFKKEQEKKVFENRSYEEMFEEDGEKEQKNFIGRIRALFKKYEIDDGDTYIEAIGGVISSLGINGDPPEELEKLSQEASEEFIEAYQKEVDVFVEKVKVLYGDFITEMIEVMRMNISIPRE